ncbi:galactokinase [Bowmanella sp. Y26]|uniref:galactokinase n=1 Tax=Bowmanella yangjiangensis TaxID=2811230 RepID=UPI001BDC9911|nr:galactokinase [Bowmanella yangjiangensis]MBT1063360.1 galactokinase [Bowmanella yangjiangensis]
MSDKKHLIEEFQRHFGASPTVYAKAPGRINLIGEHTDYNNGFVLPAGIDFSTQVVLSQRSDNNVTVVAQSMDSHDRFTLDNISKQTPRDHWSNYVRGIFWVLQQHGFSISGCDLLIVGDIPMGTGLSSSASLEVCLLQALSLANHLDLPPTTMATLGQQAENQFVGCNCGIMDQFICANAQQGHALLIDCQHLSSASAVVPEPLAIVIVNSRVKRGLVDSEYNLRRQQCEQACQILCVSSLREADLAMLEAAQHKMPELIYRRARHVISENARTLALKNALETSEISQISTLMAESHASMRDDFEITHPAIDTLVDIIASTIGQHGGARMTGGGFGGCVVALVPTPLLPTVKNKLAEQYFLQTGLHEEVYLCQPSQGVQGELLA